MLEDSNDELLQFDAFRRAVIRFNDADEVEGFIDTFEREAICELFDEIAEAARLTDYDVTAWRGWSP